MPLSKLTVERYRGFLFSTEISLRPLTILFGHNSAGKSALIRALPLVAASTGGSRQAPLALDSAAARGASFDELKTRLTSKRDLSLSLSWDDEEVPIRSIKIRVRNEPTPLIPVQQVLTGIVIKDEIGREIRVTDDLENPGRFSIDGLDHQRSESIPFEGVRPNPRGLEPQDELSPLLEGCATRLSKLKESLHWLSAVQAPLARHFSPGTRPTRLGPDGEGTQELLVHLGEQNGSFERVRSFLQRMFKHWLMLNKYRGDQALELGTEGQPTGDSIVDVGEGVSQSLPFLLLLALSAEGELGPSPVIAVEQPEMHLHPRAEKELAAILCEVVAKTPGQRILIESHSENLLLFVQLAIAQGRLRSEDVAVYWLERGRDGECSCKEITIDEEGRPHGWPPGVFSEDVELARELLLARRRLRR